MLDLAETAGLDTGDLALPAATHPRPLDGAVIVFDLDGTLIDTAPDLIGSLNGVLAEQGLPPVALSDARHLVGQGAKAMIERGFALAGAALPAGKVSALFERFIEIYLGRIAQESVMFDELENTLDLLTAEGAALAVCTNKRTDLSMALLDALDLTARFVAVVGPDRAPAPKPDPRHLLTAIQAAGGEAARALMVGDSLSDVLAAKAAGVPVAVVSFGYTETPARDLGADVLIDHFTELPAIARRLLARG
jgi:phosphoglycolate phosphatase